MYTTKHFLKMRAIALSRQSLNNFLIQNRYKNCSRNLARYIAGDNVVDLDKNTLTGRLMMYLKANKTELEEKTNMFDTKKALNSVIKNTFDLVKLPTNKLIHLIISLENEELVKTNQEFYKVLKQMDEECCLRYHRLSSVEILNILDAYMDLVPNRITEIKFYKVSMDNLLTVRGELKGKDLMRYIFYTGLMKKSMKSQKILRQILSQLTNEDIVLMSSEELCIIANSTFKTSTKISNKKILYKIQNYLNDNLMLLKDPAIFVTLMKTLRHNRYCDEDLLATISCAIFFNKSFECYTFQTYCHLLALYSDNLYYDEKLLEFVTRKCLDELKNDSPIRIETQKIRGKDIVRFLWSMSNLKCNYLKKEDIKDVVLPKVIEQIHSSELDLNHVIDMSLYLWMLNYKCYELIYHIIDKKKALENIPDKTNSKQRLNLLLTCIYFEDRPLFKNFDLKPQGATNFHLSQHFKDRPCLENIFRCLKTLGSKIGMKFEVGYQIPYMNILGITGYKKNIYKCVNIEVLDNFTLLKNTERQPSGLMQMKLRILDGAEEALIVLKENEIEDLTEAALEEFLQDELDLVC